MTVDVERSVALVTGQAEPETDAEREKLRRGDALLRAVVERGITLNGRPVVDRWPGREPPNREPVEGLTPQQQVVAQMVLWGWSTREIAVELALSSDTVRHVTKGLRQRTGERTTWRAALVALLRGWL